MPWVAAWIAVVMEGLVAASLFLARNPRTTVLVQRWMERWVPWVTRQSFYMWQQVEQVLFERGPTFAFQGNERAAVVRAVINNAWDDMLQLGRYYNIPEAVLKEYATQLETRVVQEIAGWIQVPALFQGRPPPMPPLW